MSQSRNYNTSTLALVFVAPIAVSTAAYYLVNKALKDPAFAERWATLAAFVGGFVTLGLFMTSGFIFSAYLFYMSFNLTFLLLMVANVLVPDVVLFSIYPALLTYLTVHTVIYSVLRTSEPPVSIEDIGVFGSVHGRIEKGVRRGIGSDNLDESTTEKSQNEPAIQEKPEFTGVHFIPVSGPPKESVAGSVM
ncbi:hypothetical protein CPB84DRAFT_1770513 [Gymnopilus junonius]|uniref:Uncharacterized protein n=1 Tax=Gymnopilus junonius TaxID=109634 RepID=A0A9P5TRU3_GYMJU|nr:hypothetical protein CPB84DRAFT_1770513 [Gymnopilus junonius]